MLVTGATGGVGCLAVGILAHAGYRVVASTGKESEKDFLMGLGAADVISREAADDQSGRPLLKSVWAGAVDTVGGNILATAIKSAKYGGVVTCCGNVASVDLPTSVFPFILRDVRLIGVATPDCPAGIRATLWEKMAGEWKLPNLDAVTIDSSLDELDPHIESILKGGIRGRVVVDLFALTRAACQGQGVWQGVFTRPATPLGPRFSQQGGILWCGPSGRSVLCCFSRLAAEADQGFPRWTPIPRSPLRACNRPVSPILRSFESSTRY